MAMVLRSLGTCLSVVTAIKLKFHGVMSKQLNGYK